LKETWTRGQEPRLSLYLPNAGSDEVLGQLLVPSHSLTPLTVWPLAGLQQPHRQEPQ